MKYIAILRQNGGCDYTIGCGVNTIQFEAENALEAGKKLKEIVRESYSGEESQLSSAVYYEVGASFEADMKRWYSEFEHEKKQAIDNALRDKELAELERLKKKYNQ